MEGNKIVMLVVATTVSLLLILSVMIPVVNNSDLKTKEYHDNEGIEYYSTVSEVTMSGVGGGVDPEYVFSLTIDGETVTPDPYTVIFASDSLWITLGGNKEFFAMDVVNNKFGAVGDGGAFSLSVENGTYTATFGTSTITGTTSDSYVWNPVKSDYVMAYSGTVNDSTSGIGYVGGVLWGSKQGIVVFDDYSESPSTFTLYSLTDFVVTTSDESSVSWEITDNKNGSYDVSEFVNADSVTPVLTIMPTQYYTLEHNSTYDILNVTPLLLIIGIILVIAGSMFTRR